MRRFKVCGAWVLVLLACKKIEYAPPEDAGADGGKRDGGLLVDAGARDGEAPDAAAPAVPAIVPESHTVPPRQSDELTLRMRHLMEAIANDNADLGRDLLYPRKAFLKAHEGKDTAKLWDDTIYGAFKKEVHRLHTKIPGIARATFQSYDVGQVASDVPPRAREWVSLTHHARHGKLILIVDRKPVVIPIGELVAHNGYWYLVKL